jgi:crotonobetainyl-CoA:carnitine CoA-transferase CaiB-like acyl-CoA transferase
MTDQPSVLGGIKVLEIGGTGAVPYCGRLLAMLGAGVVKVEPPGGDQEARRLPPLLHGMPALQRSAMFYYLNAGKQLVTADTACPSGGELVARLARRSDVIVHNRVQVAGLELGPDLLRQHGSIIQCAITPYGWTGPKSGTVSSDLVTNAVGGDSYLTPAGLAHSWAPEREPLKLAGFAGSYAAGLVAVLAVLSSLFRRASGLGGDFIDVSEQDVHISMSREQIMWAANENVLETRDTRAMPVGGCFECADGFVQVYVFSDEHWMALRATMGDPAWAKSADYATALSRAAHSAEINAGIADWVRSQDREVLYRQARERGVTLAPFLSPGEIITDEHEKQREYLIRTELPDGTEALVPSRPFLMSQTPVTWTPGPIVPGASNRAVYRDLGLADSEIEALAGAGVI